SILLGDGNGKFSGAVHYGTGKKPLAVAIADLNRDGRLDLVVADYESGTLSLLLGKGDGTFADAVTIPVGERACFVAVGDFNRDGIPDLAVAHSTPVGRVSVLLG